MGQVFFTSDHHFGHQNIISYCARPWDSVEEMTEGLVEAWNETVHPDDLVYYLGDFAMGRIDDTLPIVGRLNGTKLLVPGNHDRCWRETTAGAKLQRWTDAYHAAGFSSIFAIPSSRSGRSNFSSPTFPTPTSRAIKTDMTAARLRTSGCRCFTATFIRGSSVTARSTSVSTPGTTGPRQLKKCLKCSITHDISRHQ